MNEGNVNAVLTRERISTVVADDVNVALGDCLTINVILRGLNGLDRIILYTYVRHVFINLRRSAEVRDCLSDYRAVNVYGNEGLHVLRDLYLDLCLVRILSGRIAHYAAGDDASNDACRYAYAAVTIVRRAAGRNAGDDADAYADDDADLLADSAASRGRRR